MLCSALARTSAIDTPTTILLSVLSCDRYAHACVTTGWSSTMEHSKYPLPPPRAAAAPPRVTCIPLFPGSAHRQ